MKCSLVVMTPGKSQGKVIPLKLSEFLIGRDPECHLRPATAIVSKRHCALQVRGGALFIRDLNSTNGTTVNGAAITGEKELHNGDRFQVGPLVFAVQIEAPASVNQPTPLPPTRGTGRTSDEEEAAALLLSLQGDGPAPASGASPEAGPVPEGSTVFDVPAAMAGDTAIEGVNAESKKASDARKASQMAADTSTAAKAILEKYLRRPRT